jgi:hypothetical protein
VTFIVDQGAFARVRFPISSNLLFIAIAATMTSSAHAAADSSAAGFVEGSSLNFKARNCQAKNLALRLRWATLRGGNGYGALDQDTDEYRTIIDDPTNVF